MIDIRETLEHRGRFVNQAAPGRSQASASRMRSSRSNRISALFPRERDGGPGAFGRGEGFRDLREAI